MTNLASAKAAIEAEIAHAKEGLAHFISRIESLEKALLQIVSVDGGVIEAKAATTAPSTRGAKSKSAKPAKKIKGAKSSKGGNDLPFTGGDFWTDLVNAHPQSASDILNAAIASLGFTPSKEQTQKLTQRLTFALNALVKAGKIQDSGKGRERRFFK